MKKNSEAISVNEILNLNEGVVDTNKYIPPKKVEILGEVYKIEIRKKENDILMRLKNYKGYCNMGAKLIVIEDFYEAPRCEIVDPERWIKRVLRHEITHAFLNESGLNMCAIDYQGPWAKNEEMVDWIAIQGPKLYKTWEKLGLVD